MAPRRAPDPKTVSPAAASRRIGEEMIRLDARIDKEKMGSPERLALLREQASLSDEREAVRSRAAREQA